MRKRVLEAIRAFIAAVLALVGVDEVLLGLGLVLMTIALWPLLRFTALLVPGTVITWLALPSRRPFVDHPMPPERRKH